MDLLNLYSSIRTLNLLKVFNDYKNLSITDTAYNPKQKHYIYISIVTKKLSLSIKNMQWWSSELDFHHHNIIGKNECMNSI